MATDLFIISNISTSKEEVFANKDLYLKKLKDLHLEHITVIGSGKLKGDWEYEFPYQYDEISDSEIPDEEAKEILYYSSPFVFDIRVYQNCLELTTIYRYGYLYEDENHKCDFAKENLREFRQNILDIISIFGGTEIIYLADNGCDKLSAYLELWVWEGRSYAEIKCDIMEKKLPIRSDYENLKFQDLSYGHISEIIIDDFHDLKA